MMRMHIRLFFCLKCVTINIKILHQMQRGRKQHGFIHHTAWKSGLRARYAYAAWRKGGGSARRANEKGSAGSYLYVAARTRDCHSKTDVPKNRSDRKHRKLDDGAKRIYVQSRFFKAEARDAGYSFSLKNGVENMRDFCPEAGRESLIAELIASSDAFLERLATGARADFTA